jgi:ABC-type transport system involved in cytochrome c biogenesis ATPase subunit
MDVKIEISNAYPVVICGENNIGKTNVLRALNVFFNHMSKGDIFKPDEDIPHHIFHGSQGAGSKTELIGTFELSGKKQPLKVQFGNDGIPSYTLSGKTISREDACEIIDKFQFLFVESHNVDLPSLISVVLEKDGLLRLDTKRKKQSEPLEKLEEFIRLSLSAISDIERDINICFENLTDFDGILKGKKIKINFAEFEKLRDVVKTMTEITLHDGNNHGVASKGSGAQRAVFLSLMQFISQNSKKKIIWGVDEPEAFLQPKLQRRVFDVFTKIVSDRGQPVILTTHSQHFINLNNLDNTHIFKGEVSERSYARKPGKIFYETNTAPIKCSSGFEKASLIKKHLGISNNDGWEVLPYNLLVEGEEDKKYIESLMLCMNISPPNIVWAGGASKIGGYLQYYDNFSRDLAYKPKFICVFDNDDEGRDQAKRISKSYKYIDVSIVPLPRFDGLVQQGSKNQDWEIEDFLTPSIVIDSINEILKKDKYSIIKKQQISNRCLVANIDKQILKYAEECTSQNNPDKQRFVLDDQGRKMQICHILSRKILDMNPKDFLTDAQVEFIRGLSE